MRQADGAGTAAARVGIIGAGAAGTLVALHLAREASILRTPLDVLLVDPAPAAGRGVAYRTPDDRHLLNVPAGGMSALPDDADHFVSWLARERPGGDAADFVPRAVYGKYLEAALNDVLGATPTVSLRHRPARALAVRRLPRGLCVELEGQASERIDALVVATGLQPPGTGWAPPDLLHGDRFVADPWAPGALPAAAELDGDVLLVGTGLTAVDVALTLARPGRVLHAVSRRGRLPAAHRTTPSPTWDAGALERAVARLHGCGPLPPADVRALVSTAVTAAAHDRGDWRGGFDDLRPVTAELWGLLDDAGKAELLRADTGWWDLHRHRMPPATAAAVARLRAAGELVVGADHVVAAVAVADGLRVSLASGRTLRVAAVVNCTGPSADIHRSTDPLVRRLLADGLATPGPCAMGLRTDDGRLVAADGRTDAPVWTLGALRRGELWESTAIPEIRAQAAQVAADVVAGLPASAPRPVRRPVDVMGLPLTTTPEAAAAFNHGLDAVMRVRSGAAEAFTEAVALDPGFALGHAALALLGHEAGADVAVAPALSAARVALGSGATERERSLVEVVSTRVRDCRGAGARSLVRHIGAHPRDVLAVSAAVPTIAFSGVTDIQEEAWQLVEGLSAAYDGHWWHRSLLAFVRQDQERYDEAAQLADNVLASEPAAGHAVHARTHVYYETGEHTAGLRWLDPWIRSCGRRATHRAHYSWHAALHELSAGDCDAVRRRYTEQLAPPSVTGVRGLVDSASLLWRCSVTGSPRPAEVDAVLEHVHRDLVEQPETPFMAMHSAVALAAAGDATRLRALRRHAAASGDPVMRSVVAPLTDGLAAVIEARWADAVRLIRPLLDRLVAIGGSRAQREVVEDTYLYALVRAGRAGEARSLLDARLDRRPSPLDRRRRLAVAG